MRFILLIFLCVGTLAAQDSELANYRSAVKLAFGVGDGSDRGTAYAEEYFYHDKVIWDSKVVYIKDTTPITATGTPAHFIPVNWNGVTPLPTSVTLKYRLDQDMSTGRMWSGNNSDIKNYTAPLTFATMTLPDGSNPVGVTGPVPGVTPSHDNKAAYYWRGSTDSAGNEYHTLQWCGYVSLTNALDSDYQATDGKFWVFCVNPKTPCLTVRATGNGQFYTTPIKNYHLPKIFDQTTYFNAGTGTVTFELRNLYASDVRYRINGGSWVDAGANNVTLDQDDFSTGTNTLEYYYEGNEAHVKTRTVVKNPTRPSLAESHGDLLWGTSDLLTRQRARRAIAGSVDASYWARMYTNKNENQATTGNVKSGSRTPNGSGGGVLICSFLAHELGITATPWMSGLDASRSWALHAKTQLLNSRFRLDPVGLEVHSVGNPIPSREIKDRGYYVTGVRGHLLEHAFAYDILVDIYRSDQNANGITPIEDYLIRDWMARWQVFNSCELGFYYNGALSATNMWERSQYILATVITMAMPSYSTPWGGTSGWDGNTTTYTDIPYPDVGHTWKSLYIDEDHAIPGFPNPHQRARYDNLFTDVGAVSSQGVLINEAWADRMQYSNQESCGFPVGVFAMMVKLHTGKTYPKMFKVIERGKEGQLYAQKYAAGDEVGPRRWALSFTNNSLYPKNSAQHTAWYLSGSASRDEAIKYGWIFTLLYFDTTYAEDTNEPDPEVDVTPPTLTSATINAQGNRLTLIYSEDVEDVNPAHYSLSTGNTLTPLEGVGNTWQFTISSPIVVDTDTPTLNYTSGAGRTADTTGNLLATISARAVTNNSLETTPVPPRAGRRGRGSSNLPAGR